MTTLKPLFEQVKKRISEQIAIRANTAIKASKKMSLICGVLFAIALYTHIFHIPKESNYLKDSFYSFLYLSSICALGIMGTMTGVGLWLGGFWKQIRNSALSLDFNIIHGTPFSGSVDKTCQKLLPEENAQLLNLQIEEHEMQFLYNRIHERGFIVYDDLVELQDMMNLEHKQLSEQELKHAHSFLQENNLLAEHIPRLLQPGFKHHNAKSFKGKL